MGNLEAHFSKTQKQEKSVLQSRVEIKHYSVPYFDRITGLNSKCCSTVFALRVGLICAV